MELTGRRYERTGVLAVDPMAFTMLFAEAPSRDTVDMGGVPVVTIRGPLEHHAGMWCDSYDAILARASEALSGPSRGVVLRIDSPGGFVSGCMETARAIRALADGSGKTLVAYVDGQACSAAYAIACVAHSIVAPPSATLGSIGVLMARTDASGALASAGVRLHMIKSGARKGDGTAEVPVSADELAAIQDTVDTQAGLFFDHVAACRSLSVDAVSGLQAGVLIGARAVSAGLADVVGTLDDALAMARGEMTTATAPQESENTMPNMEDAIEALRAAAEGDNAEESARAKRMLAAMDPEEEPEAEDDAPPPKDDDEEKPKDESDAKAIAMRAEASALRAERATILATRPDLSAETKSKLAGVPVVALAAALSAIPRTPVSPTPPKAEAPVLGECQGGQGVTSFGTRTIEPNAELDRAMGISRSTDAPIVRTATYTQFGTLTREQANETIKKIGGAR